MFEAEHIMSKTVITVAIDTPIYEAMNLLVQHKISGLPVIDAQQRLRGIITEKDVIRFLLDENVDERQSVADYMNKDVKFFSPKDSVVSIAEFFVNNPFRRVPIVENGKMLGIVARRDIIVLMLKIRGKLHK